MGAEDGVDRHVQLDVAAGKARQLPVGLACSHHVMSRPIMSPRGCPTLGGRAVSRAVRVREHGVRQRGRRQLVKEAKVAAANDVRGAMLINQRIQTRELACV